MKPGMRQGSRRSIPPKGKKDAFGPATLLKVFKIFWHQQLPKGVLHPSQKINEYLRFMCGNQYEAFWFNRVP